MAVPLPPGSRSPSIANSVLKRRLDLVIATVGLVISSPLLAIMSAAIRVTMGRPVFFRQQRAGLNHIPFTLIKFRTMRPCNESETLFADDAARLTRLGRLLRDTSLDELPTLWNVIQGDMSIVGPRPLPVDYLPRYAPEHLRRHEVRPGITGLAQVSGRNALTWDRKFELDVWYVDHHSMRLDLRILYRTLISVIRREGISHEASATMPEFMGQEQ